MKTAFLRKIFPLGSPKNCAAVILKHSIVKLSRKRIKRVKILRKTLAAQRNYFSHLFDPIFQIMFPNALWKLLSPKIKRFPHWTERSTWKLHWHSLELHFFSVPVDAPSAEIAMKKRNGYFIWFLQEWNFCFQDKKIWSRWIVIIVFSEVIWKSNLVMVSAKDFYSPRFPVAIISCVNDARLNFRTW